jgi:L-histidine N-alpha-methyltransferase
MRDVSPSNAPAARSRTQESRALDRAGHGHRADRSGLSVEAANELRDALGRRQKELPARWLAAVDTAALRAGAALPGHQHEATERELGLALLRDHLTDARPRGVVCIRPSESGAALALADALCARGSVVSIAAAELDPGLAVEMRARIASRGIGGSSSAVACDCTIELPLPDNFPRPRVYLCLGNVLGCTTAVGAVRLLRVLRTTMGTSDTVIVGLHVASGSPGDLPDSQIDAAAERHASALALLNATVGADFDLSRFEFRSLFDAENSRVETHLVARKTLTARIPGMCELRFRKGESIRTSVSCRFERSRVAAMLAGVGLTLREWTTDAGRTFVVALASPAV